MNASPHHIRAYDLEDLGSVVKVGPSPAHRQSQDRCPLGALDENCPAPAKPLCTRMTTVRGTATG